MRLTFITAVLAIAGASLAAPANTTQPSTTQPITTQQLQKDIQTLQFTIVSVINDIVQSNKPKLKTDFEAGSRQFASLVAKVSGPQSCSPFVPGKPKTATGAVGFLQKSQASLNELSLDLMDPANKIQNSDFHADVCVAWGYYWGDATFVGA